MTARHLALVGPTASGKSALALEVAEAAGAEIVSLDSMQVYRGMDVGTAKPAPEDRARVTHHLVDVADPGEDWSVVRTQRLAREAIAAIEARGRRALLVGGTGLYVTAVVDGLAVPSADDTKRQELEDLTASPSGLADAYRELQQADPVAAARIEPRNRRRVVRALEVVRSTGRSFSASGPGLDRYGPPVFDVVLLGLWWPRWLLAERIGERFAAMREQGLVDEVRRLATGPLSRTAAQAIGYKEVLAALRGDLPVDEAFELAVARTRALARRQRVWFRRDPRITWVGAAAPQIDALVPAVLATWGVTTTRSVRA